jgi:lipopolysaccharide export system protein LptA
LNNPGAGKQSCLGYRPANWGVAVFEIAATLLLWAGTNCKPISAQTSNPLTSQNRPSPQTVERVGKIDRTGVTSVVRKPPEDQRNNPGSGDSSKQDSQTPFGNLANNNRGPISIQSDSLALDYKQNAVLFNGHVRATQADGALTSNILRVKYGKDFHEVQDMAADGNVHISQGVRWCTSDHAVMSQQRHTVILTGSPICHDAQDQIAGTKITVHLDTGKSDVEAAKAVIFPQQSKTRDNEALANKTK